MKIHLDKIKNRIKKSLIKQKKKCLKIKKLGKLKIKLSIKFKKLRIKLNKN